MHEALIYSIHKTIRNTDNGFHKLLRKRNINLIDENCSGMTNPKTDINFRCHLLLGQIKRKNTKKASSTSFRE